MTSPNRWITVALALAGACAFAVSVWVGTWWTIGEATVGPFGARMCFEGECGLRGLRWMGGDDLWMRSAIASGVGGVVAMFVLICVAGAAAARRTPRLLARTSLVAIVTALACAAYFFANVPNVGSAATHVEVGGPLFALGGVLGIAGAVVVLRQPRA
jgi:hypothetical protein